MMFGRKTSEDLERLLHMLHYYLDRRLEGQINVTGRKAIVDLIQTRINNRGLASKYSAWEVYRSLFEAYQEPGLPAYQRAPRYMHKQIERDFRRDYGRFFFDKDIIQFYVTVAGQDAQEIMKKYQHERV